MSKLINFWFMKVSRGYSLPMSITNWLVIFSLGILNNGNIFYGILALIGFMFAQMGTNVFDDVIDQILKVPKQKYKSTHLDNGETTIKTILILAIVYFVIAAAIGLFLTIKCGWLIIVLATIGGLIALFYPRANHFALGELAVGLTFGPLLFIGVYYVMTKTITIETIFISIPVVIFTVAVLMAHALMDYDFDKNSNKKTLCILVGSKTKALNLITGLLILAYLLTITLIHLGYLPILAAISLPSAILIIPLYKNLKQYISTTQHATNDFINNFALTRNIGTIYCFALAISIFVTIF